MSFEFGKFGRFSDPVTKGDPVIMAGAKVIQPGPYVGRFYQAMGEPDIPLTQLEFDVYSRSKTNRDGAIGDAWDADDISGLKINANALKGLTVGHVLKIENEVVIIKSVDRSAGTISVYRRGEGDTTAAAHDAATAFKVIGSANTDDDIDNIESMHETSSKYSNYAQLFLESVDWVKYGTLQRKGLKSEQAIAIVIEEAQLRFAKLISTASIHGVKQNAEDDTTRNMSAGLFSQLADSNGGKRVVYNYNANGPISSVKLNAAIKELTNNGGNPTAIWVSPTMKGFMNNLIGSCNSDVMLTGQANNHTAGGIYVNAFDFEGLILPIRVDSDIPDDKIAIVNQGECKKAWLVGDGLALKDEPGNSRKTRKSLQGTIGFLIENVGVDHTYIYGVNGGPTEHEVKVVVNGVGDGVTFPIAGTVAGGISATGAIAATGAVTASGPITRQLTVNADSEVPAASADNYGFRVLIGTGWTEGTKIVTAVAGEVWASNGAAWVKQS